VTATDTKQETTGDPYRTEEARAAYKAAAKHGMVLALWADRLGDTPAIVCEHGDRTFASLNARTNQLVRALRMRGLRPGDSVALMLANRPEWAEVVAATNRAGWRLTPINWHLTGEEAGYILGDCEARAFIADHRFADAAIEAAGLVPAAAVRLAIGGDISGFEPYEDALDGEDGSDIDDPLPGTSMLYTSGTTGRPKGVHRAPVPATDGALFGYQGGTGMHLCTGPLYHAAPLAFSLAAPLNAGVGVVLMDEWSADETLRLIEQHAITHSHMVPTMFHRLLSLPPAVREAADVSSLQLVLHGAAPCPVAVKQAIIEWWGPVLFEYYAATEGLGTWVTSEQWLDRPGTVGPSPAPGFVRILGEEGQDLAPGEIGRIYLLSPAGSKFDYYKDPAKTESSFVGDHFTLGDVGYLDEDGWLFLTDRSANLIISGGVNIYPAEVEAELLGHPAVGDAAVIGVPDDDWGEIVVAVVEPQPDVDPTEALAAELVAFCRDRLAHFKCPRRVDFTDELPRHDNGKLYKRLLRDQYRQAAESAEG
jgi:long-chain acyl-CoA synthetase